MGEGAAEKADGAKTCDVFIPRRNHKLVLSLFLSVNEALPAAKILNGQENTKSRSIPALNVCRAMSP